MTARTPFFWVLLGCVGCASEPALGADGAASGPRDAASSPVDAARPGGDAAQRTDATLDGATVPGDAGATTMRTSDSAVAQDSAVAHDTGVARDGGVAHDGGAGASPDLGFCPGYTPESFAAYTFCRSDAECPQPGSFAFLCLQTRPTTCGGAAPPPNECESDPDCGTGRICTSSCSRKYCESGCSGQSCGDHATCVAARCVPIPCDRGGASCPSNAQCSPGAARADTAGCIVRQCTTTADCPCGTCFKGECALHPGLCFSNAQAP
jgi:hypothetical protein